MSEVTKPILLNETGERMATALEHLVDKLGTHTLTIQAVANDGGEITDQTVKIYDLDTGVLYGECIVNSTTSNSVEVPNDFSYEIIPVDTMSGYYCTDKPSGIATKDTTITLTWKTLGSLSSIVDLKAVIDKGMGKYIKTGRGTEEGGQQVSMTHSTLGNITFDCVDFDSETETMTLLMHDTLNATKQFDNSEALLKATSVMGAGNYTFKNGSTSYYFTTTQDIPVGGQLRATTSNFYTYTDAYSTSEIESGTVSTTALSDATDLGTCASGLLNHMDRVNYGSNDYGESAIRQWLNGTGTDWWSAKTMFDRPPTYVSETGFMSGIDDDTLNAIDTTEVKCVCQNTYVAPDSTHVKNTKYTVNDKFFLASQKEVFGSADFDDGTTQYEYYVGSGNADRIKKYGTSARSWWLRSPTPYAYYVRNVNSTGVLDGDSAYYGYYSVVVACKISKSN